MHRALDLRLFRALARTRFRALDETLPRLTRAGNKSVVWMIISALLAAAGGRFGRRAAARGIVSIAGASAIVNLVAKRITRDRPGHSELPVVRRLKRMPASSSFPSGHTASAFAFATGASMEVPALAGPLGTIAAAMGLSRVYTGAHYPSDVVVGAAFGAAVAWGTKRWWPLAPHASAEAPRAYTRASDEPSADGDGLVIAFNDSAGSSLNGGPVEELREALPRARIVELDDLATNASGARALGVAGGDGSVNVVAVAAHQAGRPLMVVPSGTLNHFAHEIGLNSVSDAVDAIHEGHTIAVDVACVADRPFLNAASLGAYAELVDERERLEGRIGKWPAAAVALVRVLRRANAVDVEVDGQPMRIWLAFIGNCLYSPRGFAPRWRERLDDGLLDVRLLRATRFARMSLLWHALTGTIDRCRAYDARAVQSIRLRSMNRPLRIAFDGETADGSSELVARKLERPLAVFVPG